MTINPVSTGKTQIIVSGGGRQTTVEVTVLMNGYKTLPQVAAGEGFTVALDKDGKVYTWGKNDLGQLGDQGKENRIVPTEITFDFADTDFNSLCAVRKINLYRFIRIVTCTVSKLT